MTGRRTIALVVFMASSVVSAKVVQGDSKSSFYKQTPQKIYSIGTEQAVSLASKWSDSQGAHFTETDKRLYFLDILLRSGKELKKRGLVLEELNKRGYIEGLGQQDLGVADEVRKKWTLPQKLKWLDWVLKKRAVTGAFSKKDSALKELSEFRMKHLQELNIFQQVIFASISYESFFNESEYKILQKAAREVELKGFVIQNAGEMHFAYRLQRFFLLDLNHQKLAQLEKILKTDRVKGYCASQPYDYFCLRSEAFSAAKKIEVAVVADLDSPELEKVLGALSRRLYAGLVVAAGEGTQPDAVQPLLRFKSKLNGLEGSIFVCEKSVCRFPTRSLEKALKQIQQIEGSD